MYKITPYMLNGLTGLTPDYSSIFPKSSDSSPPAIQKEKKKRKGPFPFFFDLYLFPSRAVHAPEPVIVNNNLK